MPIIKSGKQSHNLKILLRLLEVQKEKLLKPQRQQVLIRFSSHGINAAKTLLQYYVHINSTTVLHHDNK